MRVLIMLVLTASVLWGESYRVIVQEDVYRDYTKFLNGRSIDEIEEFGGPNSRRDVVELIIMKKALKLGGFEGDIEFFFSPTDTRNIESVKSGVAVARGTSFWGHDLEKDERLLYKSYPLVKDGDFEAGFYALESNKVALQARGASEIKDLKVVSSKSWTADWRTLENLRFYRLYDVEKWESMINMLIHGRMDIVLAPFQRTDDLSFEIRGHRFLPIENYKIAIEGTRNFAVSKKHPKGKEFIDALDEGLRIMDNNGLLEKIYEESGFYNDKVKNWKTIE